MIDKFKTDGPILYVPPQTPCNQCPHIFSEHSYLYTIGNRDYHRCRAKVKGKSCDCGMQYEVRGMALTGDATPQQVERAMEQLAEGAGEVIDPRRIL